MRARERDGPQPLLEIGGRETRIRQLDEAGALVDVAVTGEDEVEIRLRSGTRVRADLLGDFTSDPEELRPRRASSEGPLIGEEARRVVVEIGQEVGPVSGHHLQDAKVLAASSSA